MFRTITIPELKSIHENLAQNEIILDVRTPEEFAGGHVPGSLNIPFDEIERLKTAVEKSKTAYLYCRSGGRVGMACQALETLGLKNFAGVISGGMPNWISQGFPVE